MGTILSKVNGFNFFKSVFTKVREFFGNLSRKGSVEMWDEPQKKEWWPLIEKFIRGKFTSFGLIGIGLTVFGAVFIEFAVRLHMQAETANLIQAFISVALNFVLNRMTTWKDRRDRALWVQILRYVVGKAISIPLNQFVFVLVLQGSTPFIAYMVSTVFIMFYNFFLGDKFVFGKKSSSPHPPKED